MSEILGTATPSEPQPPEMEPEPSPDVARDIQRDALALARSDAWLNIAIAVGLVAATAVVAFSTFFVGGPGQPRERSYSLVIQFAIIDLVAIVAAIRSWRRYRQLSTAVATDTIAPLETATPTSPQRHLFMIGSRPIILLLVLASLGLQWQSRRNVTGPLVFRNASITTNTGFVQERMTVAVADGRIVFVGRAEDSIPSSLTGARHIDAMLALVSAATFDRSVASPLDALRHTWVGQVYEGAPGDLVITPQPVRGRGRGGGFGGGQPREILGAVVNGRYYTATELQRQ